MGMRYLSVPLSAEEVQTLVALAVLIGKPEQQILGSPAQGFSGWIESLRRHRCCR
jgi:hypothetical protein